MNNRIISKKTLSGNTKYEYCPYCLKKCEENGQNYKEKIKPMVKIVMGVPTLQKDNKYAESIEEVYECLCCQRANITPDDFSLVFGDKNSVFRAKGVPFEERTTIWDSEKRTLVPAHWDNAVKNYVQDTVM